MTATTWTTILGIVQAVGVALVDFFAHTSLDGGAMKQPTFWLGLIIAAAMAVKGFLTKGIEPVATKASEPPTA